MHQIERIGVTPNLIENTPGQETICPKTRRSASRKNDECRRNNRPKCCNTGEARLDRQYETAGHHTNHPGPAEEHPQPCADADPRLDDSEQRPGGELPQPRSGVKVGVRLVTRRQVHRVHEVRDANSQKDREQNEAGRYLHDATNEVSDKMNHRPQHEHLPLHRERPEVLEGTRRRVIGIEVIHRRLLQMEILVVTEGCEGVSCGAPPRLQGHKQKDREDRERDGGRRRRKEPGELVDQELHGLCDGAGFTLGHQRPRHQIRGDQQEDVHTAGHLAEPDVEDGHKDQGDRPQSLHFGDESGRAFSWRGHTRF